MSTFPFSGGASKMNLNFASSSSTGLEYWTIAPATRPLSALRTFSLVTFWPGGDFVMLNPVLGSFISLQGFTALFYRHPFEFPASRVCVKKHLPLDIRWKVAQSSLDSRWESLLMQKIELLQGTLDMLILKVLNRGPMHGFGIAERIQQLSKDVLSVGEGSLYPALYRLQERGWIESEWGQSENNRRAKYYQLTKAGRKQLETEATGWEQMCAAIARIMQSA